MIPVVLVGLCLAVQPPADWPFERIHGVEYAHGTWVAGGLRGLGIKRPNQPWEIISKNAVRQTARLGHDIYVLYGNGAVDKLDVKADRLYFDVLYERAKRPWTSVVRVCADQVLFGGHGGWTAKSGDRLREFYPSELAGETVTAIDMTADGATWVGTQRQGLFRFKQGKPEKFGIAKGLPDTWVTGLSVARGQLFAGTASGGLVAFDGGQFRRVDSPSLRVRSLTTVGGRLVVGTLEGTWLRGESGWQTLGDEETTCVSTAGGQLWLGEPGGLRRGARSE